MLGPDFRRYGPTDFIAIAMRADARAWIDTEMGVVVDDSRRDPFALCVDHSRAVRSRNLFRDFRNFAIDQKNVAVRNFTTDTIKHGRVFNQRARRGVWRIGRGVWIAINLNSVGAFGRRITAASATASQNYRSRRDGPKYVFHQEPHLNEMKVNVSFWMGFASENSAYP